MLPRRNPTIGPNALEIESPKENVHPEPMDIPVHEVAPLGKSSDGRDWPVGVDFRSR